MRLPIMKVFLPPIGANTDIKPTNQPTNQKKNTEGKMMLILAESYDLFLWRSVLRLSFKKLLNILY